MYTWPCPALFSLFFSSIKKKLAAPSLPKDHQKFWKLKQVNEAQFSYFLPWQGKEGCWQRLFISFKQQPSLFLAIYSQCDDASFTRCWTSRLSSWVICPCPMLVSGFLGEFGQMLPSQGLTLSISLELGSSEAPDHTPAQQSLSLQGLQILSKGSFSCPLIYNNLKGQQ